MTAKRTPSYRLHKPSGRAFVEIDGRRHYLGKHDLPTTEQAYHALVGEWIANGYRLPVPPEEISLLEVCDAYLEHCETYYATPDGIPSSTLCEIRMVLREILARYGSIPASQFGPNALRAIRKVWIDRDNAISTINARVGGVKRMFKWAASHEMLPETAYRSLATLDGLRRGRGQGKDPVKRFPARLEDIEATLPHLPRVLQAVIRVQLYSGARPSEVLNLKRGDIDCTGDVWTAIVREHKNSFRGKERRLFLGPRAQTVLRPFLLRNDGEYVFSPKESEQERHEKAKGPGRRPWQKPNTKKTDRCIGECYEAHGYARAIR
jgi:integrase